ncbi:acyltransferase [Steroidobacter sp. S1-65]|uniref:Acyltransferase n=1 Tax=Steroidobacter gossypii TaxID=2805490 RepID=A0ABS1WXE4_9GAMM|nr:acyltransferase family protein [Steroidobacter gossypii]MBM0105641.1 acyltransferase [Steroidobacter gossypii]
MEKRFREDIEGLRGFAILAVVVFHFGVEVFPGGFVGVDIFFVIAGYLITGMLLGELERTRTVDLWRFYGRRAQRSLPLALVVSVVTLLLVLLFLSPAEQTSAANGALAASLYASNLWFMTLLPDYFAPESIFNPFLHTWALSAAAQFYLVWPVLLLLLWRWRPSVRNMAVAMTVLTLLSFALCLWLSYRKQSWAFYASPTRAWEFGVGALAALRPVTDWARRSRVAVPIGWLGLAVLCATVLLLTADARFPGWIALVPVLATAAILISGVSDQPGGPAKILKLSWMQWLGKRSYAIYLWHWPIVMFARVLDLGDHAMTIAICSALAVICAAISFRWLERPMRSSAWLAAKPMRAIAVGAMLIATGVLIAVSAGQVARMFSAQPVHAALIRSISEEPLASGSPQRCLIMFKYAAPVSCTFGASESPKTVVLFGDSHADQWSTPLAQLASEQGWRLVTFLKATCSVADIVDYNPRSRRYWPECAEWRARAIDDIQQLQPDLVILSQMSNGFIQGPWTSRGRYAVTYEQWEAGLRRSLQRLRAANVPVLLLRDSPLPRANMGHCVGRARWRGTSESSCDVPISIAIDPALTALESAVAASTGAIFADLTTRFCDEHTCPAVKSGVLVYKDANHITEDFAKLQVPAFRALLEEHEFLAAQKH